MKCYTCGGAFPCPVCTAKSEAAIRRLKAQTAALASYPKDQRAKACRAFSNLPTNP